MMLLSRGLSVLVLLLGLSPVAHASLDDEIDQAVGAIQAWDIRAATTHAAEALKLAPEDPTALAGGIRRALAGDHPPVAHAVARAQERFGVARMVAGTCEVYRDILGGS